MMSIQNPLLSRRPNSQLESSMVLYNISVPVNGGFSQWTDWSECSTDNGIGVEKRTRACDNPKPEHGGADCSGETEEKRECRRGLCYSK